MAGRSIKDADRHVATISQQGAASASNRRDVTMVATAGGMTGRHSSTGAGTTSTARGAATACTAANVAWHRRWVSSSEPVQSKWR